MDRTLGTMARKQAGREKMHTAYLYCEGTVKVLLAALVKLAVCGAVGMVTAALLLDLTPTPYLWACSCAGILANRWLSRLVSIKPKKKKHR